MDDLSQNLIDKGTIMHSKRVFFCLYMSTFPLFQLAVKVTSVLILEIALEECSNHYFPFKKIRMSI